MAYILSVIEKDGEPIVAIEIRSSDYEMRGDVIYQGAWMEWPEDIHRLMDRSYDMGFGRMEHPDVDIWTKSRVYFVHEYDGSTCLDSRSGNPTFLGQS